MNSQIDEAVKILDQGGIIIFPTDTAFGIGCRVDNEKAIQRLFEIRKRPLSQATPVLVNGIKMAKKYVTEIPTGVVENLINPFWPGALTIVLKANTHKVSLLVTGGGQTIGLRMPNHAVILSVIGKVGVPVLGPSANFHGENTPYEFKDLNSELISLADYVIKGECVVKKPSTVVDCTKNPWEILRQGAIEIKI
jgi:L-threonylcarbamoyladenylate synthase